MTYNKSEKRKKAVAKTTKPAKKISLFNKKTNTGFLPFAIDFAKKYHKLPLGEYPSPDKKYKITIIEKEKLNTTRVCANPNEILIGFDSSLKTFSGVLFFLVWAFVRLDCMDSLMADKKVIVIIKDLPEFDKKDMFNDFITVLAKAHEPVERVKNLLS